MTLPDGPTWTWEHIANGTVPPANRCGHRRSKKSGLVSCELPQDHVVGKDHVPITLHYHQGRDGGGRWHQWKSVDHG